MNSGISSRSSVSSFKPNTTQHKKKLDLKNERFMENTKYANDCVDSADNSYESSGPSSKKKLCIIMFGVLIAGLLTYNYLNSPTSTSSPIVI